MVTTSNTTVAQTTTAANNHNMLVYSNNNSITSTDSNGGEGAGSGVPTGDTTATLEKYRLQLYNYALSMERLRGPPYTAAAAMAATAVYASTTTESTTTMNCPTLHTANYTTGQVPPPPLPTTSYLCSTTAGRLIGATTNIGQTPDMLAQCPSSNRLAMASISLFPQRIFQQEEPKPQHSYIGLIAMAILSSSETKLVLSDIYQYILDNYPYFRTRGPGWRNSIRHNLSLNDCFIKSGRSANGKGHYWAIHPANMEDFRKGDFRRRKAQRKVRKHMGLAVDDNGTDSPSPPPPMDLTSPSPPSFQHIVIGSNTITAAQHLAAQSFGWRFTQHQHHRQHPPHHVTNGTAASYMGQIFTYRPQQYVAAAAAAALCHSGNTQQHHQQQLVATTSLQQHHTPPETSIMQPASLLSTQSCINATNIHSNVINELFSQKRKRQFDVASLLAPDYSSKRELQQQQQEFMRKHAYEESETNAVTHPSSFNDEVLAANQTSNELDIEDIDVVDASEDEDLENDYDEHDDEVDSNSNSQGRLHSHNDDNDAAEYVQKFHTEHCLSLEPSHCKISKINITADQTMLRMHDFEPDDDGEEEPNEPEVYDDPESANGENETELSKVPHNSNNSHNIHNSKNEIHLNTDKQNNSNLFNDTSSPLRTHATKVNPLPTTIQHFIANTNQLIEHANDIQHPSAHCHHQLPTINTEAHNLFGRYYGSYMAAAAAARINSSVPSVNTVGNIV